MTKTKRPEAILFDLGSTLLHDSQSGALSVRVRSLLKSETFAPFVKEGFELPAELADAGETVYREGLGEFNVREWLGKHIDPNGSDPSGTPDALEGFIRSTILSYSPPQDASRVLNDLIRLGIPMAVVSNSIFSTDLLKRDIERLSVPEAVQFVISSAEFGFRKPHPAIFEAAVKKLNTIPSTTWYVGDLWENDVVGSTGAGLVPVWLNAHAAQPENSIPHHRVKNWTEFGELLGV
jgi:putative hydrolase of the HAD superfamily